MGGCAVAGSEGLNIELTVSAHSRLDAFLEAAGLAAVASPFFDTACSGAGTRVPNARHL